MSSIRSQGTGTDEKYISSSQYSGFYWIEHAESKEKATAPLCKDKFLALIGPWEAYYPKENSYYDVLYICPRTGSLR